jgi:anti-sigma-K factor RskA
VQTHVVHLLAGAYALDSLGDDEILEFENHLETCGDCRTELASMREAVVLLAAAVALSPPDGLRGRVVRDVSGVRPLPPRTTDQTAARVRRCRRTGPVALAAAAALIAAIGVGATVGRGSDDPAPVTASAQVMHAADRAHTTVESDRGWEATVWRSDSVGQAVIVTHHLPPAPEGLVYQLWLDQPASGRVSAGTMSAGGDQTVVLVGDATTANGAAITLEPTGGSTRPSSDPIATFDFGRGA